MSSASDSGAAAEPTVLYCHCKYAKVLPVETKRQVLAALTESERPFEAVADLCEMSARKDPALGRLRAAAEGGQLRVAACFPRAVEGLFRAAGQSLPENGVEVVNLRDTDGAAAAAQLLRPAAEGSTP